jgi:hypothetical protein
VLRLKNCSLDTHKKVIFLRWVSCSPIKLCAFGVLENGMVNCDASVCACTCKWGRVWYTEFSYHIMPTCESLNFVMVNSVFFTDDKLRYARTCDLLCYKY